MLHNHPKNCGKLVNFRPFHKSVMNLALIGEVFFEDNTEVIIFCLLTKYLFSNKDINFAKYKAVTTSS